MPRIGASVEIAGMRGLEDGTLRGDPHGPLWIAWLASALMWGANVNGLAHTIVRLPFEASFLFFFSAVVAVASVLRTRYFILVALLVSIAVPRLYGTVTDGDRDSFRLTALLLLSSFLLAHLRPKLSTATHPLALVLGAALVAFCEGLKQDDRRYDTFRSSRLRARWCFTSGAVRPQAQQ